PLFELIVAIDDPGPWTTVLDGRLPAPCTPSRCEALLASESPAPDGFDVARPTEALQLPIVGRGLLHPAIPFESLDQAGAAGERPANDSQTERRAPAILVVNGVNALAQNASLDRTGRTYIWAAPLRSDAIRPWTVADFSSTLASVTRQLTDDDRAFTVSSPIGRLEEELGRADTARGRLLLIGSLAVAILLAFAVFASLVGRADLTAEIARLRTVGARRRDVAGLVVLEAVLPVVLGAVPGVAAGVVVVSALAAWQQITMGSVLGQALLAPGAVLATAAILVLAVMCTIAVTTPSARRHGAVRIVGAVGATAVALLGWQLVASGSLEPTALARLLAHPAIVVVPPAIAFLVALAFLTILPPLLRALARRSRGAPLAVRLSILSVARDPERPAATVILLAFSLGAIVFATGWSASLRQGIDDQAAYRSGLDLRVTELGTALSISQSVVPVERYASLGGDVTAVPVFRGTADVAPGGQATVLALDPSVLASLPGWRADFADVPIDDLATRLEVPPPPDGWHQAGHRLPAGEPEVRLRFRYTGEPLKLSAVVETDGGDHAVIRLGTISDGMTEVRAPLPQAAIGGTLIALTFIHDRFIYGPHQHELRRGTITFEGLDGLVEARPIEIEIFTVSTVTVRAPQATDGLILPALVSPDLAAAVDPDGLLRLEVGGGRTIELRVVATARRFPTVVDARPRFVVVP
ncbi:MAG TPA: FtsX-like permease family protein, partial [Methylomirabilota bacterium]|nr:FtsX-like permease family protein [Methylomirabilota bacterium]